MSTLNVATIKNGATANITLDTAGNATVGNTLAMGSSFLRNRIINGDMRIDQRNAGAPQTFTAGTGAYSVDRWRMSCGGANVTGQRVAGSGTTQYRYQFTGASGVTSIYAQQRIEQLNSYDLAGQTVTLSVDMANSLLTSVTWSLQYADAADNWSSATQIATGTLTVNSTVTRYSVQISVPAAATTGLMVQFNVGSQTSGTWTFGNVQLEVGSVATPFERRQYGQELALCQRYCNNFKSSSATDGYLRYCFAECTGASVAQAIISLPVRMRSTPSLVTSTPSQIAVYSASTFYAATAIDLLAGSNTDTCGLGITVSSGLTVGRLAQVLSNGNNTSFLLFSAEL